jgi:hypothetical protein
MGQAQPGPTGPEGTKGPMGTMGPRGLPGSWSTFTKEERTSLGNLLKTFPELKGATGDPGNPGTWSTFTQEERESLANILKGFPELKGDPGKDGTVSWEQLSVEQQNKLKGKDGYITDAMALQNELASKTMWCADGSICKLPEGKNQLSFLNGSLRNSSGQMWLTGTSGVVLGVGNNPNTATFTVNSVGATLNSGSLFVKNGASDIFTVNTAGAATLHRGNLNVNNGNIVLGTTGSIRSTGMISLRGEKGFNISAKNPATGNFKVAISYNTDSQNILFTPRATSANSILNLDGARNQIQLNNIVTNTNIMTINTAGATLNAGNLNLGVNRKIKFNDGEFGRGVANPVTNSPSTTSDILQVVGQGGAALSSYRTNGNILHNIAYFQYPSGSLLDSHILLNPDHASLKGKVHLHPEKAIFSEKIIGNKGFYFEDTEKFKIEKDTAKNRLKFTIDGKTVFLGTNGTLTTT